MQATSSYVLRTIEIESQLMALWSLAMCYVSWFCAINGAVVRIFIFVMESSEETQNEKTNKNQSFQYSSDMDFKVCVSACGTIQDNQA